MKDIAWKKISHFEGPEQSPGFLLWQLIPDIDYGEGGG